MHEHGLAEQLVVAADACVPSADGARAIRVVVAVGAGAASEAALRAAFELARPGTKVADAELVVEAVPLEVRCLDCGAVAVADGDDRGCSECGSAQVLPVAAPDVVLRSVEVEV